MPSKTTGQKKKNTNPPPPTITTMKLCIDPGHGMSNRSPGVFDPGATHQENGTTFREADIALRYALTLRDKAANAGVPYFMTRDDGEDPAPVGRRAAMARAAGCDTYVSLHLNDFDDDQANGLEVLYRDQADAAFARRLQDALITTTGLRDRDIDQRSDLAVLRFDGRAVLIELGFIANDGDRGTLLNPQMRDAICETILRVVTAGAAPAALPEGVPTPMIAPGPLPAAPTTVRRITAYNYEDNSPAYSDYVARGRHQGGGGAPPNDSRADIGRNNFAHPSSIAVSPEAGLAYGTRVFVDGYGWFLAEDRTQAGLSDRPRFDVWTAGATQAELHALDGWRAVTVFAPGVAVPPEWQARTAGPAWQWQLWTSSARVAQLRDEAGSSWHGLYIEGQLRA
jgi:N-acetylmuramoyl-L-alanine amidase